MNVYALNWYGLVVGGEISGWIGWCKTWLSICGLFSPPAASALYFACTADETSCFTGCHWWMLQDDKHK